MGRFGSHYSTHDGYPSFYSRPMDDLDDDECEVHHHPVPVSRLLVCYKQAPCACQNISLTDLILVLLSLLFIHRYPPIVFCGRFEVYSSDSSRHRWSGLAFAPSIPTSLRRSIASSKRKAWVANLTPKDLTSSHVSLQIPLLFQLLFPKSTPEFLLQAVLSTPAFLCRSMQPPNLQITRLQPKNRSPDIPMYVNLATVTSQSYPFDMTTDGGLFFCLFVC